MRYLVIRNTQLRDDTGRTILREGDIVTLPKVPPGLRNSLIPISADPAPAPIPKPAPAPIPISEPEPLETIEPTTEEPIKRGRGRPRKTE